jgi:hypothetical protein
MALAMAVMLWTPVAAAPSTPPDEAPKLISTTGGKGSVATAKLPELQKLAAAGNPRACLLLGVRYETGDGVKQDYEQARKLYEQAAAGGVAEGTYRLGKFFQDGLGVEANPYRARDLYQQAAMAGFPLAQYNLGAMLAGAHGVGRDYVEGLAWLIIAHRNKFDTDGERRLRAFLADRPETIAAAELRAEELRHQIERGPDRTTEPANAVCRPGPAKGMRIEPEAPKVDVQMAPPKVDLPKIEPQKIDLPAPLPPPPSPPPPAKGNP